MRNDFFNEKTSGPSKEITLQQAVRVACGGGRIFFSKRLAPPLAVCNARVYCGDDFLFSSDIDLKVYARLIAEVADLFNVKLEILYEHGDTVFWCSDAPDNVHIGGKDFTNLNEAYEYMKPHKDAVARRWAIDHHLARRNPIEWFDDTRYLLKWKLYGIKRWFMKLFE